jgi:hypothetical protein
MVLLAPVEPQTKPEPDQGKILQQARIILRLTNIIRDLQRQIQKLLNKSEIQHLNQLETELTTKNSQLYRLKILAIISVSLGLIGTVPHCVDEVENTTQLLTKPVK